jgi:hypothetical protein
MSTAQLLFTTRDYSHHMVLDANAIVSDTTVLLLIPDLWLLHAENVATKDPGSDRMS